jgi:23S rRNA (uracil1939-C5)-methyltransferase
MSRRQQRLPATPVTARVEKFSHDGRGIARIEGKATFIQHALPDETVTFQYLRKKRDFDEGKLLSVIEPSPHRVEPRCPHYTLCGGCSLQHLDGSAQIHEKQALLLDLLARIGRNEPETILPPLKGPLWNYRNKARLSVRFVEKKQAAFVGFREKNNPRYITEIDQCPVLNAKMDKQIINLRRMLDTFEAPHCIAQIELAAGDDDIALIFRNLSALSEHDEEKLREFGRAANFRIFLQPAGPDSVYLFFPDDGNEFLTYRLPDENITIKFHPTDFTQVNAELNRSMIQQALMLLELEPHDVVLDLFCGLGNFSLPLARHCAKVIGVEGSDAMVLRAQMNAEANGLTNTKFFCANLEDEFALASLGLHKISKLLLDPPRTGAMEIVKHIDKINPQRIVYVSCNPATLARDADILVNEHGYKLISAGVMDMFPHTAHVESIALFEK